MHVISREVICTVLTSPAMFSLRLKTVVLKTEVWAIFGTDLLLIKISKDRKIYILNEYVLKGSPCLLFSLSLFQPPQQ